MIGRSLMSLTFTCKIIAIDSMALSNQSSNLQKSIAKLSVNSIAKKNSWPSVNMLILNKLSRSYIEEALWKT